MKPSPSTTWVAVAGCAALLCAVVLKGSNTYAAPAPAAVLPGVDCWEILERPCNDCPQWSSFFCNPLSTGNLIACVPAQSVTCETGGCFHVNGTTGVCP